MFMLMPFALNCGKTVVIVMLNLNKNMDPSVGQWSERNTSLYHTLGVTGSGPRVRKPEKLSEGMIVCLDPRAVANSHAAG